MIFRKQKKIKNKSIKEWGRASLLALILALTVKGFIIQSFVVSSLAMEKTLHTGDFVFVNKLKYGARFPITVLSVPFVSKLYVRFIQLPYLRMPGFGEIEKNDLVVFNYPAEFDPPIDKKQTVVKRCVALPGDTLSITDKELFVNRKKVEEPEHVQFNYRLVTDGTQLTDEFMEKYGINEGGIVSDIGIYDFPLTNNQLELIKANQPEIRYIRELKHFPGEQVRYVFPIGYHHKNNKDFFAELVVPYKGMNVKLDTRSIEVYRDVIEAHEGNRVEVKNYKVYINGKISTNYTIKKDYYFVMDDNRDNAKDSRYFGFLPEDHVIGNVLFTWFSIDKNRKKVRWDRVFKSIN